jgi:hypothetical protein
MPQGGCEVYVRMTFLAFTEIRDTGKTKVWSVDNSNDGSHLGVVKWYGGWRKYVLATEPDCIWSPDCLNDVAAFIGQRMADRRAPLGEMEETNR